MDDILNLAVATAGGGVLGAIFFGGLWWTVSRGMVSTAPGLWFFGSLMLRTVLTIAGFYVISGGHWDRMLLGLLGFVSARFVVTRLTRQPGEISHAP